MDLIFRVLAIKSISNNNTALTKLIAEIWEHSNMPNNSYYSRSKLKQEVVCKLLTFRKYLYSFLLTSLRFKLGWGLSGAQLSRIGLPRVSWIMHQQGMRLKRTSPKAIRQTGKQMLHVYDVNVTTAQHSHLEKTG